MDNCLSESPLRVGRQVCVRLADAAAGCVWAAGSDAAPVAAAVRARAAAAVLAHAVRVAAQQPPRTLAGHSTRDGSGAAAA